MSSYKSKLDPVHAEWWRADELGVQPHEILENLVRQIEEDQSYRYAAYREWAKLFGADPDVLGGETVGLDELHQNELANTIETLHAQVFKNNVVPGVSTSEADWEEWQRGKAYSRWIEGVFDRADVHYDAIPRAGLDTLVYGTGFIKIGHEEDEDGVVSITFSRVDTRLMSVDRLEARAGKPRNLFQKDYVDRFKLLADYGCESEDFYVPPGMTSCEAAEERVRLISQCTSTMDPDMPVGGKMSCDMLTIREAWHLPSKPGADDGAHAIWIGNCTLVFKQYTWNRFPFIILRHGQRLGGFYGESAVKRLAPTQKQFNKLNTKIDEAQDIMGVPRIIVDRGAHIERSHLDDIPGGILESDNINGIKEWNATAVSQELYMERDAAPKKMRSLLGVSDFEVQNQLPQSMREISGPAMERWVDQGSARHSMFHKELERAVKDMAYLAIDYAEELQEKGKDLTVVSPSDERRSVDLLKFSDVKVDKKRMRLRVQPMNQLPQTFSGKVDAYGKLLDMGVIDPKKFLRMVEIPDTSRDIDMLTSAENVIMRNISFMMKTGKYLPPLPYDNFDLIISLTTAFINDYRTREDADLEKVSMLGAYAAAAFAMKKGDLSGNSVAPPPPDGSGAPALPPEAAAAGVGAMPPPGAEMPGGMPPPPMEGAPPPPEGGAPIGPPGGPLPFPGQEGMMPVPPM